LTVEADKKALARYRLRQAGESLGGVFDKEMGRCVIKAFDLRQRGDYREYFEVTRDQAVDLVPKAEEFVSIVGSHIDAK